METKKIQIVLLVLAVCLSVVSAAAQDSSRFYAGLSFSLSDATIIDQFTRYEMGVLTEKNTFEDEYTGQAFGFFLGCRFLDKKHVFINLQLHGSFFSSEFLIETSSSVVKRKLACSRGIDLQPGCKITKNLIFFLSGSIERGRFQFSKEGTTTTYNVEVPMMGYGFGMGVGYRVFPSLIVRVRYQYNQFGSMEISTALDDLGTKVDVVELLPRYDLFLLSVQYNFGK